MHINMNLEYYYKLYYGYISYMTIDIKWLFYRTTYLYKTMESQERWN